jgi:hypothetical protein
MPRHVTCRKPRAPTELGLVDQVRGATGMRPLVPTAPRSTEAGEKVQHEQVYPSILGRDGAAALCL